MSHIPALNNANSLSTRLSLPGSKSLSNRALIMAALCSTPSELENLPVNDDVLTCQRAVTAMKTSKKIDCRDAGTVARFLLPVCAALSGEYHFDGSPRLRERPLTPLIEALQRQGVQFDFAKKNQSNAI